MSQKRIIIWINILVAVIIVSIILYIATKPGKPIEINEETIKCIAEKSMLFTKLGCNACQKQEDLFGENYKYIKKIDCFYELDKCQNIEATPTWKIKGKYYVGVQTIEKLQELTDC